MSADKTEGATQKCGKCDTPLICVKIIDNYNGGNKEKLQWQNVEDKKPHYMFAGPNKWNCKMPPTDEEQIVAESEQTTMPEEIKSEINSDNLPELSDKLDKFVTDETMLLLNIEERVAMTMHKYNSNLKPLNDAKVGMFVKEIYRHLNNGKK